MRSKPLLFALLLATAACEQILQLDKYVKCDAACDASSDVVPGDASDASSDVIVIPDSASEASSWPLWRMENTLVEVQNGAADASLSGFTPVPTDAGTVLFDGVTKLVWKTQLGTATSVDAAAAFCKSIGGRLPTRIEIATLLDSTRKNAPYITPAFDAVVAVDGGSPLLLWTSSYYRPVESPLHFWFANLLSGDMVQQQGSFSGVGVVCLQ